MKILTKISNRFYWLKADTYFFFRTNQIKTIPKKKFSDFTIGITTFLDRYDNYFKELLDRLVYLFPDREIIVAVNGHVKKVEQNKYLEKITSYSKKFNNVFLIKYVEPQGLSKLWNDIIKMSSSNKILMLNDDLKIAPTFRTDFECTNILFERIAVINNTWGHFLITKETIEEVGWFDENLLEIGGEDDDYCARLAMQNIPIKHFNIKSIANFSKPLRVNSYGKDMTGKDRYSSYNANYLLNVKWIISDKPLDGGVYVPNRRFRYWKMRNQIDK